MNSNISRLSAICSVALLTACGGGSAGGGDNNARIADAETAAQVAFQAIILSDIDAADLSLVEPFFYEFEGSQGSTQLFCDSGTAVANEDNQNSVTLNANDCRQDADSGSFIYDGNVQLDCDDVDAGSSVCNEGTVSFGGYSESFIAADATTTINFSGAADVNFVATPQTVTIAGNIDRTISDDDASIRTSNDYASTDIERVIGANNTTELSINGAATFSSRGLRNCAGVGEVFFSTLSDFVIDEQSQITAGSLRITQNNNTARVDFNGNGSATVIIDGRTTFFTAAEINQFCID